MILEKSATSALVGARVVPHGVLHRFVDEIRVVVRNPSESVFVGLPQAQTRLIFRLFTVDACDGKRALSSDGVQVLGARTRTVYKSVTNNPVSVVVRFRPGCAQPFFRVSMQEAADRLLPIEELWGADGRRLHERLLETIDANEWPRLIEAALQERLQRLSGSAPDLPRAALAVATIRRSSSVGTVRAAANELGLSERQLRRIFNDEIGMAPKEFLRILRFHRALRAVPQSQRPDWSSIAAAAGYYDQPHFITEWRRLTAMTPGDFLRLWRLTSSYREPLL